MSKVTAEMPSKAQQNDIGTDSTNLAGAGTATGTDVGGRTIPAGGILEGATVPSRTVAFIGFSGITAMRAVSLRGPMGVGPFDFSTVDGGGPKRVVAGRTGSAGGGGAVVGFKTLGAPETGFGGGTTSGGFGAGGRISETGGPGFCNGAIGGRTGAAGFTAAASGKGVGFGGRIASGGWAAVGGRSAEGGATGLASEGTGAGGRAIGGAGGRMAEPAPAGGKGFGASGEGGGRTGVEPEAGRGASVGGRGGPPGGRFGRLIRTVSFCSAGAWGFGTVRGGNVMRTVSFFGSFKSAMEFILEFCSGNYEKTSGAGNAPLSISNRNQASRS